MRASSATMLLIAVLMIIIILALIVIIGLTVRLQAGCGTGQGDGAIMQFVSFSQDQVVCLFDALRQWFEFLMAQIQKVSEHL
ncbi:MAG: hypothetical protein QFX32_08105 [Methanolinea sp.]|nr:hypothetical protein [Methanolinea sp.]